jgi:hypothetical protein
VEVLLVVRVVQIVEVLLVVRVVMLVEVLLVDRVVKIVEVLLIVRATQITSSPSTNLHHCHNPKLLVSRELTKFVKHHTLDIYLIYTTTL